ncbi:MAG: hypothetical protein KC877_01870 [Candidatus Kaiserbacteria bacterium]|nr:hypothetical protein [Candidatus Kaiserbacteria bacterium]MCB9815902.1 hypothetical protein [Candidatus Nomurabacteria bacterium]
MTTVTLKDVWNDFLHENRVRRRLRKLAKSFGISKGYVGVLAVLPSPTGLRRSWSVVMLGDEKTTSAESDRCLHVTSLMTHEWNAQGTERSELVFWNGVYFAGVKTGYVGDQGQRGSIMLTSDIAGAGSIEMLQSCIEHFTEFWNLVYPRHKESILAA